MQNFTKQSSQAISDRRIAGVLLNSTNEQPLAGYHLRACVEMGHELKTIASGFSHLDGGFILQLSTSAENSIAHYKSLILLIESGFGKVVGRHGPLQGMEIFREHLIKLSVRPEDDQPQPPIFHDPFVLLAEAYGHEIAMLRQAGLDTWERFRSHDLEILSMKLDIPVYRLQSFLLHGEMNTLSDGLTTEAIKSLVALGIKNRADLAFSEPNELNEKINKALQQDLIGMESINPSLARDWIAMARGWKIDGGNQIFESALLDTITDKISRILDRSNPKIRSIGNPLAPYLVSGFTEQAEAIANMRAIMTACGVYDLSALNTFYIRGRQVIQPGYHFSLPNRGIALLDDPVLLHEIVARGAGFSKVKVSRMMDYGMHIEPNPVTDAVILGPIINFVENGELVISRSVTSLIIITREFDYKMANRIRYEDPLRTPIPWPPITPNRPDPPRPYPTANDRSVYTPSGVNDNGRDGMNGRRGRPGNDGLTGEAAPSLKIYVLDMPNGLPDIDLNGRPGGAGQHGQEGGNGEDGAKGRESVGSVWMFCITDVGHGGNGGDGGIGGSGGIGGIGGNAGNVTFYSPVAAYLNINKRPGFFLGTTGGDGGIPGHGGGPGMKGIGGEAGHDTPGCTGHPEWHGNDGNEGLRGDDGWLGQRGRNGTVAFVPITEQQFNAAFYYPFFLRMEPAVGIPGTRVKIIGLNLGILVEVHFGTTRVALIDLTTTSLYFTVPLSVEGGLYPVTLQVRWGGRPAVPVPGLDYFISNTVHFRVTPALASITPPAGAPGQTLVLAGQGFAKNAQVRIGSRNFVLNVAYSSKASVTLPWWEDIGLSAGVHQVTVINPDGSESNSLSFDLSLVYVVRMKAWRVFDADDHDSGTNREISEIRDILVNNANSPYNTFLPHSIRLDLQPNIEDAFFPSDIADTFPDDGEPIAIANGNPGPGGKIYVDPGAINIYFVSDIADAKTYAFTRHYYPGSQAHTVFEDTASLSTRLTAIVASHEIGHALKLPHVCSVGAEAIEETTFGRMCKDPAIETTDTSYLMYPTMNFIHDFFETTGTLITVQEAIVARRAASELHGK